jgi:sugar phosphate isomerase/epimerase
MKIGIVSDSLGHLGFKALLDAAVELGVQGVEVNTGNWSSAPHIDLRAAPHIDLPAMVSDAGARGRFLGAFERRGLELIALNTNGNQLHPISGDDGRPDHLPDVRSAGGRP